MDTVSENLLDVAYTLKAGGSPVAAKIVSDGAAEIVRLREALIQARDLLSRGKPDRTPETRDALQVLSLACVR